MRKGIIDVLLIGMFLSVASYAQVGGPGTVVVGGGSGGGGGVDLSPYVLLAGDADGQTIQGVAGSNKPHLSLGDTYVSLRASTDGTDETLSFLNVGATGVEIDVHDGVAQFQMNDNGTVFTGAVLRMNGMTVPTTASDPCFAGAVAWDSGFWYVCIALDTWKRTALSTW